MRRIFRFVAFFLAALAAACLPVTSRIPVGSTAGFHPDPALLGSWKAAAPDGGGPLYVHILGNEDGTMTAVMVSPPQKENAGDWGIYMLRAAALGANRYLNAQETMANGKASEGALAESNVALLYRQTGAKQVTLYRMDEKATAAAIRAGEIAGEIEPGEDGDVRLTAAEPALDEFMKTPRAAKLFSTPLLTLTRLE